MSTRPANERPDQAQERIGLGRRQCSASEDQWRMGESLVRLARGGGLFRLRAIARRRPSCGRAVVQREIGKIGPLLSKQEDQRRGTVAATKE